MLANRKAGLATKCGNLSAKGIQQRSQSFAAPALEFVERLCLNLADPFPSHCKIPANLLESVRVAVIESEPHPDDLFLAIAQNLQDCCRGLLHVVADNDLSRRNNATVFDQITQVGILFFADGRIERNGCLRSLQNLPDLAWRESHAFGDLFGARLATELRYQLADRAHEPVDPFNHVDGDRIVRA